MTAGNGAAVGQTAALLFLAGKKPFRKNVEITRFGIYNIYLQSLLKHGTEDIITMAKKQFKA